MSLEAISLLPIPATRKEPSWCLEIMLPTRLKVLAPLYLLILLWSLVSAKLYLTLLPTRPRKTDLLLSQNTCISKSEMWSWLITGMESLWWAHRRSLIEMTSLTQWSMVTQILSTLFVMTSLAFIYLQTLEELVKLTLSQSLNCLGTRSKTKQATFQLSMPTT